MLSVCVEASRTLTISSCKQHNDILKLYSWQAFQYPGAWCLRDIQDVYICT